MENCKLACPICQQPWPDHERASEGDRTFCSQCGALLELIKKKPPQVIKISKQAADFGI